MSTDVPPDERGDSPPDTGESREADAPIFLSFGSNVSDITEGQSVIFTAVLTDPQGIGDLIGGTLRSPDGNISYGAFVTSGQEGAYSLSLSWAAIGQAQSIEFEGRSSRRFMAEFFDQAGKRSSKVATVEFYCDGQLAGACDGMCIALGTDKNNCGHCQRDCARVTDTTESWCEDGACLAAVQSAQSATCEEVCARRGAEVTDECWTWAYYEASSSCTRTMASCSAVPAAGNDFCGPFDHQECGYCIWP